MNTFNIRERALLKGREEVNVQQLWANIFHKVRDDNNEAQQSSCHHQGDRIAIEHKGPEMGHGASYRF